MGMFRAVGGEDLDARRVLTQYGVSRDVALVRVTAALQEQGG